MIIVIIALITIALYVIQLEIYQKKCFKNVGIELKFRDVGVFEGDDTELGEAIVNKKWLPLWWVTSRFRISKHIEFENSKEDSIEAGENKADYVYRRDLFSIGSYQKVTRKYDTKAVRRGYYTIDSAELVTGDLFGKCKFTIEKPASAELYVYPLSINSGESAITFEKMMGEILSRRKLMEDPFQIRGIRDYNQFDSLKKVNWNATARTGELKVNEYDYTTSQQITILLNFDKMGEWDGEEIMERSISAASSIAQECIQEKIPVGMISNGLSSISDEAVTIKASNSPDHSMTFYKNMALINTQKVSSPFYKILDEMRINKSDDDYYVLVSEYTGKTLQDAIKRMKQEGFKIYWIIPKKYDSRIDLEFNDDVFVWEVMDA